MLKSLECYRVIVQVILNEPVAPAVEDDGSANGPIRAYYQTFGVTARAFSSAVALVEAILPGLMAENEAGEGVPDQIEVELFPGPPALDSGVPLLQDPTVEGVHFVSGRIYFSNLDDEDQ